jgi:transaldolase / glucose-6-phosphate isomerase
MLEGVSNIGAYSIAPELRAPIQKVLDEWTQSNNIQRLWDRDANLWTNAAEAQWLGWLDSVQQQAFQLTRYQNFAQEVRERSYTDVVLLGMGGSSLCPDVLAKSFGPQRNAPRLHVLDSTDPAQVRTIERAVNMDQTLFIVASKSGSTLEPNVFKQYFFERTGRDGSRFVAITDPGSHMEQVAQADRFAHIFHGNPSIGGRYSALSAFGLVPAAAMGIDLHRFLDAANSMVGQCSPSYDKPHNPGINLGVFLGTFGRMGRDKLTIVCSPGLRNLGGWLEQLVAESTGKEGKGLVPVDLEPLTGPSQYGADRIFAYIRLGGKDARGNDAADPVQDEAILRLQKAGFPVVQLDVADVYQLGAEFFRWEIATAIAGSIIGINPFDQPDVEAAKIETRKLTAAYEESGSLPDDELAFEDRGIKVYGTTARNLESALRQHFSDIPEGGFAFGKLRSAGYVAILAYIEMTPNNEAVLNAARERIRNHTKAATCLGFGPRFLHSTGQAYKGGPDSGIFLQITADDAIDVHIPGQKFTFGVVKAAQAAGDLAVLRNRGRRCLRLHLGKDVRLGIAEVAAAITRALQ